MKEEDSKRNANIENTSTVTMNQGPNINTNTTKNITKSISDIEILS